MKNHTYMNLHQFKKYSISIKKIVVIFLLLLYVVLEFLILMFEKLLHNDFYLLNKWIMEYLMAINFISFLLS